MENKEEIRKRKKQESLEDIKKFINEAKKNHEQKKKLELNSKSNEYEILTLSKRNQINLLNDNSEVFLNQLEQINSQIKLDPVEIFNTSNEYIFENYSYALNESATSEEKEKINFILEKYQSLIDILSIYVFY